MVVPRASIIFNVVATTLATPCQALLAYDCGGDTLNTTTISLLEVGECEAPQRTTNHTDIHLQLLQTAEFMNISLLFCRIEIERHITHCGMHSHSSVVLGGRKKHLLDLDHSACKKIHHSKSFQYGQLIPLYDLTPNVLNHRSLTLAGSVNYDGACEGATISTEPDPMWW